MSDLLRKPAGLTGVLHEITPENARGPLSADWTYVGFALHRLKPGCSLSQVTGDREVILVLVEGKARITAGDQDLGELGERMDVFEQTPPHCVYVPNDAEWSATATTDCTLAICSAPGKGGHVARILPRPEKSHSRQGRQYALYLSHRHGGVGRGR